MAPSNVLNKRKSLPLIHALEIAGVAAKRELETIYTKPVLLPEDVSRVVDILDQADACRFAEEKAGELLEEARECLDGAGLPGEGMESLRHLGRRVLEGGV
jgi:geranylgeranyl pyrophosphate synthase